MLNKIYILAIIIAFVFFNNKSIAQCNGVVNYAKNQEELNKFLDTISQKHELNIPKIVFTLKIDSLGEIHSCHIRVSNSLVHNKLYSICCEIECCINAMFLYEEYKCFFPNEKYVYINYPFKPN